MGIELLVGYIVGLNVVKPNILGYLLGNATLLPNLRNGIKPIWNWYEPFPGAVPPTATASRHAPHFIQRGSAVQAEGISR